MASMACSVPSFPVFTDPRLQVSHLRSSLPFPPTTKIHSRNFSLSVSAKAADDSVEKPETSSPSSSTLLSPSSPVSTRAKKSKVPAKNQQVMLRFVWMDKNIGIAVDHVIPGHGTAPLSPYFFWPRKDAWEEIKTVLESKKWISRKQTILLLNQATDVINLWQQNATG